MISGVASSLLMLPSSSSSSSALPVGVGVGVGVGGVIRRLHNNNKSTSTSASTSHGRLTRRTLALAIVLLPFSSSPQAQAQAQAASTTPYSQSRTLQLGLDANGKIRTCPSTNPGCVCTNPTVGASSSVASPLLIPEGITSAEAAAEMLRQAIIKTQKNVSFITTSSSFKGQGEGEGEGEGLKGGGQGQGQGQHKYIYIQAEVDGGGLLFGGGGRDVMEFLVNMDAGVVAYRCVARDVTFVYPFTTAVGDSRGQEQRIAAVAQELGWYAPDISSSLDADDA